MVEVHSKLRLRKKKKKAVVVAVDDNGSCRCWQDMGPVVVGAGGCSPVRRDV